MGYQMKVDDKIFDDLSKFIDGSGRAVTNTLNDLTRRVPSWVAQEVGKEYNTKKGDITPTGKGIAKKGSGGKVIRDKETGEVKRYSKAGSARGSHSGTLASFTMTYKGRLMTPVHFSMTPSAPTGRSYTLRMTVKKGRRVTIGHYRNKRQRNGPQSQGTGGAFLIPSKSGDGNWLPFVRMSPNRKDLHIWKTTSVPQEVDNDKVNKQIYDRIQTEMMKRLDHNLSRL